MNFNFFKKNVFRLSLFFSILFLPAILLKYLHKQDSLILESNNLLSPGYYQGNQSMNKLWVENLKNTDQIWLIGLLGYIDEIRIMSIYAHNFSKISIPVNEGRMFSKNDTSEAIIGKNVLTFREGNKEFYVYNGKKYSVIGRLGLSENSPLSKTVLLNDSSYLYSNDVILFFDGPGVEKASWLKGDTPGASGIHRLLFITKLSSNIIRTVILICISANALWIYFYQIVMKEMRIIMIQSGVKYVKVLIKETLQLSFCYLACIAFLLLFTIDNRNQFILSIVYILLWMTGVILNSILFMCYFLKGKLHETP